MRQIAAEAPLPYRDGMGERDDRDSDEKGKSLGKRLSVLGRKEASAGLTFGIVLVVFTLAGFWLDRRLSTTPVFLLVGLVLGGVGGFIHLVESVSPGTLFKKRRKRPKK